jgi:hypothetical protein
MTYEVQIFKLVSEGHLTKEMNKKAADGWQVISTTYIEKHQQFVITWGKPA